MRKSINRKSLTILSKVAICPGFLSADDIIVTKATCLWFMDDAGCYSSVPSHLLTVWGGLWWSDQWVLYGLCMVPLPWRHIGNIKSKHHTKSLLLFLQQFIRWMLRLSKWLSQTNLKTFPQRITTIKTNNYQ